MSAKAFISHADKDKPIAEEVLKALEARGIPCWIAPRDVAPGKEYAAAIIDGINESQVMVVILSLNANESQFVHMEVERARSKGLKVIPFRIERVEPAKALELFIGNLQRIDALKAPRDRKIGELAANVQTMLGLKEAKRPGIGPRIDMALGEMLRKLTTSLKWAGIALGFGAVLGGGAWGYRIWVMDTNGTPPPAQTAAQVSLRAKQHLNQGLIFASMKDYENARIELTKAIEIEGGNAAAYANRGVVSMQQQKYNLALDDLKMAEKLAPQDRIVQYNMAALYSLQNQRDRGLVALDKALDHGFDNYEALRSDPDLANLRRDPGFRKLLERHKVFLR